MSFLRQFVPVNKKFVTSFEFLFRGKRNKNKHALTNEAFCSTDIALPSDMLY